MKKLEATAFDGRMEEAALVQCHWLIEYLQDLRVPVHPNLARTHESPLAKLTVNETFFVEVVMKADPTQVVWVITGVLIAVDLGLLAVAMARFRRSLLILSQ